MPLSGTENKSMKKKILLLATVATLLNIAPAQSQPLLPVEVRASSHVTLNTKREQHHPELVIDGKTGSLTSYWASDFKNKAPRPHWIELDFGKEVTFNSIRLDMVVTPYLDRLLNSYEIEVCGEDGQYRRIVEQKNIMGQFTGKMKGTELQDQYTAIPPDAHPCFRFPAITARKVKLIVHDSIARLDEMSVGMDLKAVDTEQLLTVIGKIPESIRCFSFAPPSARITPGFERAEFHGEANIFYCDRGRPDSVRRYFARGSGTASLSIVLPSGWYDIFAIGGDSELPTPGAQLQLNDFFFTLPADPEYCYFWDIRTIHVEKQLELTLKGEWLLNALIVSPRSERKAFHELVDRVVIGPEFPTLKADPQPTNTHPPELSVAEDRNGFLLYTPSLQQRIFHQTTPLPEQCSDSLRGNAPGNSVKAMSLVLYACRDLPDLQLHLAELRSGKNTLQATLHPIRQWVQRSGHKGGARTYARVPELLDDNRPLFVSANSSQQFYIMVDVPADAAAGLYTGNISVRCGKKETALFPVEFTVHPFTLPALDGTRQYTAMYNQDRLHPFLSNPDFREFDQTRLLDLKRHNMNSVLFPSVAYKSKEDFEALYQQVNQLLDNAGFPKLPMPYFNGNLTVQDITDIRDIVRKIAGREILFYPVDEPHFNKREQAVRLYSEAKQVSGIRTYCTVTQDDIDVFGDDIDFRTYMITGYAKFEPDRIREECARDKKNFWWYSNAAREYPAANRYKAGFFQYRAGATGQLYWAYDNASMDPYNDFDGRQNDHLAVYTIGGRIYSTLQWEAIREGLDDLRHLYFLEDQIAQAPAHSETARQAKELLAEIREATIVDLNVFKEKFGMDIDVHHHSLWEPERFDNYRNAITGMILKLK